MLVAVMLAQRGWAGGASPGSARGQSHVPTASMRPRTPVADGGMLEGALTQDEYDALVLGGIPLMTNVTIREPGAPGG